MLHYMKMDSMVGPLLLAEEDGRLVLLDFEKKVLPPLCTGAVEKTTPVLEAAQAQLLEYFMGKRKNFEVPLWPRGTDFQQQVWTELCRIPYGETRCYGQVAASLGKPGAARAVGLANNRNPLSIVIPCHRVIGANGKLVGYGGGLDIKRRLLALEGVECQGI